MKLFPVKPCALCHEPRALISFARAEGPYADWCQVCADNLLKRCRGCGGLMPKTQEQYCGIACRVRTHCSGTENPFGCWLWTGATRGNGYGVIRIRVGRGQSIISTPQRAMFSAYEEIPEGFSVIPTCKVKACCNPLHLKLKAGSGSLPLSPQTGPTFRATAARALGG